MNRVVVVGASLAGLRAAEGLRAEGFDGELVVVGDEVHAPYNRPPLSKELLAGDVERDEIELQAVGDLRAEWRLGVAATGLDLAARRVALDDGSELAYDGLVIATGAAARPLASPGGSARTSKASSCCARSTTACACARRSTMRARSWWSARGSSAARSPRPRASSDSR